MKNIFLLLFMLCTVFLYSTEYRVDSVFGRVEYRLSGSWVPVARGQVLPVNATISTGFNSSAVLVNNNSTINVGALTRLTVEALAQTATGTSVFVPVGRVRASVASSPNLSTDFRVRTAQSTAAVRGTTFETNGWELRVDEGQVLFYGPLGDYRIITEGQVSRIVDGRPSSPVDELNTDFTENDPIIIEPRTGRIIIRF